MTISNVRSSLPLEMLLQLNSRYSFIFYVLIMCIYFYKMTLLDYPLHVEIPELIIIGTFAPIEALRIKWGHRGNLTEMPIYVTLSLLLGIAVVSICVYLSFLQGYVILFERILALVQTTFVAIESIFEIAAIASFSRSSVTSTR